MPPVMNPLQHYIPLASMSDAALEQEHAFWTAEIASADRWGASIAAADEGRQLVEAEQRRRHVAEAREGRIHIVPFLVDDPGVRPSSRPAITGAAKARAEWRPSGAMLVGAVALLIICLAAAAAMAGQTLLAWEASLAADALV